VKSSASKEHLRLLVLHLGTTVKPVIAAAFLSGGLL